MEIVNIEAQTFYKMNGMLENLVRLIKESQMCLHGLDEWLDSQDVCLMTGVSIGTLTTWRRNGKIPHSRSEETGKSLIAGLTVRCIIGNRT